MKVLVVKIDIVSDKLIGWFDYPNIVRWIRVMIVLVK